MKSKQVAGVLILFCVVLSLLFTLVRADAATENVVWTNLVHTSVNGTILQHDAADIEGGATSVQTITSGDGYVEWTVNEANSIFAVGLSNGNTNTSLADIDFGINFNGA